MDGWSRVASKDRTEKNGYLYTCGKLIFYSFWVVFIIYLMPNPNPSYEMTSTDASLLQPDYTFKADEGSIDGQDNELQEIHLDRNDFLSRIKSGEFEQKLVSIQSDFTQQDSPERQRPKTYFSIFSGRQRYLEILFRYVTKFLDEGLIDEVHLWDFCRKTEDADYIAGIAKMDPRFVIKGNGKKLRKIVRYQLPLYEKQRTKECLTGTLPKWVRVGYYCNIELLKLHILWKTMTHKMFPLFYQYYATNMNDDDILVKCDDDVLYIDNLLPMVEFARSNPQISITYPSIVNNELSAHFQMRENMIPDPRGSLLFNEKWDLHEDLVEIFTTLSYTNFYNEHSEEDYGPKLRTSWFQTYAAAWFLHDTFLKDHDRFRSEAVYPFEAPTRVSINMFAMRGETCRKFFIQSDFATDRLTDDEEALTWRMQKAFGTTSAFYLNTTCVHYSFSRQLLDLDSANKTFMNDYALLALEKGHEPRYQPDNTLYYGENEIDLSNPSANLIIGKKSVQIEALKALANLKTGGMTELAEQAKQKRKELSGGVRKPPRLGKGPLNKPGVNKPNPQGTQNKPNAQPQNKNSGVQKPQQKKQGLGPNAIKNRPNTNSRNVNSQGQTPAEAAAAEEAAATRSFLQSISAGPV